MEPSSVGPASFLSGNVCKSDVVRIVESVQGGLDEKGPVRLSETDGGKLPVST